MTKRFMVDDAGTLIDMHTKDTFDYVSDVCDLLNEQHEENQFLKSFNQDLAENLSACANARISKDNWIEKLTDENEQLKKRNKRFEEKIQRERTSFTKIHERWSKEAENKIKELSEENEHIKHTIKIMMENERTELGSSVLKQLWEAIK